MYCVVRTNERTHDIVMGFLLGIERVCCADPMRGLKIVSTKGINRISFETSDEDVIAIVGLEIAANNWADISFFKNAPMLRELRF